MEILVALVTTAAATRALVLVLVHSALKARDFATTLGNAMAVAVLKNVVTPPPMLSNEPSDCY